MPVPAPVTATTRSGGGSSSSVMGRSCVEVAPILARLGSARLGGEDGGGGGLEHATDGVGERGGDAVELGRGLAAELSDRLLQRVHPVHAAVRVVEAAAAGVHGQRSADG